MHERDQARIHTSTFQLNESAVAAEFFEKGSAGGAVGGASFRARDEIKHLPSIWPSHLPDTSQLFSAVTIEPYPGYNHSGNLNELSQGFNTQFVLADTPQSIDQILTYEMIEEQLLADSQFMDKVAALMTTDADVQINSYHFYITRRIIEAARTSPHPHHIDIQRFHSLLSLTSKRLFMDQNQASSAQGDAFLGQIGITPTRIDAEIQALNTGMSIFSTHWERDYTIESYKGIKTPDGNTLQELDLFERSMVVPLSYDPQIYAPDQTNSRKKLNAKPGLANGTFH